MSSISASQQSPKPFLIVNSHPIQYFAPLYRQMALDTSIRLKVLYCSSHGLQGEVDRQFKSSVRWDIPLLEGYEHEFISNQSPNPSIYHFGGLVNLSIIQHLQRAPKSIVLVYGWGYAVCWLTIVFAKFFGHTVCLRGESPYKLEQQRTPLRQSLRKMVLGSMLFPFVDFFLYIGQQNKQFYEHMGVTPEKLVFCPYAVDNTRFQQEADALADQRDRLRLRLNLPPKAFVVLYSGKYTAKKRPMDLVAAFARLARPNSALVLMGDGILRSEIEQYVAENTLKNVFLTGFINQSSISEYYATADAYVMCSTEEETWGLSTNEAMNFKLPIILASTVGCADDLLIEGKNGFKVACGDLDGLTNALRNLMNLSSEDRQRMGQYSRDHIERYSYGRIIDSLKRLTLR